MKINIFLFLYHAILLEIIFTKVTVKHFFQVVVHIYKIDVIWWPCYCSFVFIPYCLIPLVFKAHIKLAGKQIFAIRSVLNCRCIMNQCDVGPTLLDEPKGKYLERENLRWFINIYITLCYTKWNYVCIGFYGKHIDIWDASYT